jgi:hypothetical protein
MTDPPTLHAALSSRLLGHNREAADVAGGGPMSQAPVSAATLEAVTLTEPMAWLRASSSHYQAFPARCCQQGDLRCAQSPGLVWPPW